MLADETKRLFVAKFQEFGAEKFYKFILNYGVNRMALGDEVNVKALSPEMELIDYYDKFLVYYRRENCDYYLDIARIFRKASHRIYRIGLKKNMWPKNNKFMNLVG